MTRGTTPTNVFSTDIDLSGASAVYVTYKQNGRKVLEKTINDLIIDDKSVTAELSQEDTLKFLASCPVEIQIRAKFPDGPAVASEIMVADIKRVLKDGVI